VASSDEDADVPQFQIRYEPESVRDVPAEVFDSFLFPLDAPDPIDALNELIADLPANLAPVASAFAKNLQGVVSVGTLPYQMAAAAVAQRRFDRLWIAEQIRARAHMDETGNIPDIAKANALATSKNRFEEEMRSRETADVMANHVLATLAEDISHNETFHSACDELLRQTAVLTWGALEVLGKDLFAVWLNTLPMRASWLLKDERTKKRYQLRGVPLETLEQFGFDLSTRMGDLLLSFHGVDDLPAIREAFDVLSRGDAEVRDALASQSLWLLFQTRHVVVHGRGVIDQAYRDKTGDPRAPGTLLRVTPAELDKYLRAVALAGSRLLQAAWKSVGDSKDLNDSGTGAG
jgi:hypothetical protein